MTQSTLGWMCARCFRSRLFARNHLCGSRAVRHDRRMHGESTSPVTSPRRAHRARSMTQRGLFDGAARVDDSSASSIRRRLSIDLREIDGPLQAYAAARRMTLAASVRCAVEVMLDAGRGGEQAVLAAADVATDGPRVKVTLRLQAGHAKLLAARARSADVSQGEFVGGLIAGAPIPPRMPDHGELMSALTRSSGELAALCIDLQKVVRALRCESASEGSAPATSIDRIGLAVREHIQLASRLLADIGRGRSAGPPAKRQGRRP